MIITQQNQMTKSQGFTLIELIIVIIILGILSVTAAPKFLDISSDAKIASLNGIKGALGSTSSIAQLKAQVSGASFDSTGSVVTEVSINGNPVKMQGGFLSAVWGDSWFYVLDIDVDDITAPSVICTTGSVCVIGNRTRAQLSLSSTDFTNSGRFLAFWLEGDILNDNCYVYYYNPLTGETPSIGIIDDGC